MHPREHEFRLEDILDRIERITFVEKQLEKYEKSEHAEAEQFANMAFDAILYSLLVIGEAVKTLEPEMKARHEFIAWEQIIGLRNFLVHQYFSTNTEMIKNTVSGPLLMLKEVCEFESKL